MSIATGLVSLAVAGAVTLVAWKSAAVAPDSLPVVFFVCFALLNIVLAFAFSDGMRQAFKSKYRALDQLNPDHADRPRPKTLIILSTVGLVGSLLLGIPLLPYVFGVFLLLFLLHAAMMK